jgi:Flp pilus assembly protein TadG
MRSQASGMASRKSFPRRVGRLLRSFARNSDGVTAVEFAIVSVPFLGLLFAILETALVFFTQQGLEAATADAARVIMTGQTVTGTTVSGTALNSSAAFRSQVMCPLRSLPSFINCNNLIIDVRNQTTFASVDLSKSFDPNTTVFQTGGANCVVVMRIIYPMPVYLSFLTANGLTANGVNHSGQTNYGGGWKHMLMATQVFRNEPFGNSTATSC